MAKLIFDGSIFICESTYHEREVPKSARFRWDAKAKHWWTDDESKAAKLAEIADDSCAERLAEIAREHEEALEASRRADANIEIPAPEGLEYMPFQRAGIAYGMTRKAVLMGDEMGLGKTIQAIGIINKDEAVENVLVICPASLKLNWQRELDKWLTRTMRVTVANSKDPFPAWADVVIINYDILKKFQVDIRQRKWDVMIVDEFHYLKNNRAQRTQQVYGKWVTKKKHYEIEPLEAQRKIFLSGTPLVNKPIEMFGTLNYLDPKTWKSFWYFAKRNCNAHRNGYGWDMDGAANLDELQEVLRSTIMVRRLKAEVLTELPPKLRQVIEIDDGSGAVRKEREAWQQHEERLADLQAEVELAKASDDKEAYRAAVANLRQGAQVAFTEISMVRHETALAKVPAVIGHIQGVLEEDPDKKVVVFGHHHDVIDRIHRAFGDAAVQLTGRDSMDRKQEAVDRFQNDPSVKVFIGGILAAGVGLTLTAASHVVFAELDWVPGNVTQAEDRCHRIGQHDSVLVQHIVLQDSLDARMAQVLVSKQKVIDKALDDPIQKLEISKEPTIPTAAGAISPERKSLETEAEAITEEQTDAIHGCIQILAGMCDGAQSLDDSGFNRIDTRIGKSLAESPGLTPKQAALGKRIIQKYHRQLPEDLLAAAKGDK